MDSPAAVPGGPNPPPRGPSEAPPPASGAAVVTSIGAPASFMTCTSTRVLLRSNPTCNMRTGPPLVTTAGLTSSVFRGRPPSSWHSVPGAPPAGQTGPGPLCAVSFRENHWRGLADHHTVAPSRDHPRERWPGLTEVERLGSVFGRLRSARLPLVR